MTTFVREIIATSEKFLFARFSPDPHDQHDLAYSADFAYVQPFPPDPPDPQIDFAQFSFSCLLILLSSHTM